MFFPPFTRRFFPRVLIFILHTYVVIIFNFEDNDRTVYLLLLFSLFLFQYINPDKTTKITMKTKTTRSIECRNDSADGKFFYSPFQPEFRPIHILIFSVGDKKWTLSSNVFENMRKSLFACKPIRET